MITPLAARREVDRERLGSTRRSEVHGAGFDVQPSSRWASSRLDELFTRLTARSVNAACREAVRAKFSTRDDTDDIGAWEAVLHVLARRANITTPDFDRKRFASKRHTFLSKRFDRRAGRRVHFASAMTLLGRTDSNDPPASYLDLAEVIARHGAHPSRDLEELWRRIAFNVCVSNVDDHLRNHGFLLGESGWSLAPAYDMNPVAHGDGLALNISTTDNAQDLDLVREVAPQFRVKAVRSKAILTEVFAATRAWDVAAKAAGLTRESRERMANAFRCVAA